MDLNQITIAATDLEVSIPFYQSLGLKLIVDSSPRYVRFECPDGEATLSLTQTQDLVGNCRTVIYFECQELDTTVNTLKQQGIVFYQEPQDQRYLWREARLRDPDGNLICLFWAGENRKNPPWRVNAEG